MRRVKVVALGMAAALCVAGGVRADVAMPFAESWNAETPGDDASELVRWSYESAYGSAPASQTVVLNIGGGDNILNMNPGGSDSTGIRSQRAALVNPLLSLRTDMQLTSDGDGAGVLGFCVHGAPLYGYALAVSRDATSGAWLDLRRFDGSLLDSFTAGPVHLTWLDATVAHTYELQAEWVAGGIQFSVLVDGSKQTHADLNPLDGSPHVFGGYADFVLASNFGQQVYLDNFHAETTPEPATMGLMALGLAGLAIRRRRGK